MKYSEVDAVRRDDGLTYDEIVGEIKLEGKFLRMNAFRRTTVKLAERADVHPALKKVRFIERFS